MDKIYIHYLKITHPFIQQHKSILNHYVNNDCFKSDNKNDSHDHFSILSTNMILFALIKDIEGKFEFNNKKFNVVSFFVNSFDNNNCIIWDVCTPQIYRRKHYFSHCMNYFLKKYRNQYNSISLYVDYQKDNYINLVQMYSKFGFKIVSWGKYYKLQLFNYPTKSINQNELHFNFKWINLYKFFYKLIKIYKEFHFHVDDQWKMTIQPQEVVYHPLENNEIKPSFNVYSHDNYHYIYPHYKTYYKSFSDFIYNYPEKYFQSLFFKIFHFLLMNPLLKMYSQVLNPHQKNDVTPRFFICIVLKK